MKSLHCKRFITCLLLPIIPLVIGEDDIARNKLTFQSTTTYPFIASLATDSTIEINDFLKCSKTNQTKGRAWWTADLEEIYTATKVCILNVNSPSAVDLKIFKIKVSNYPLEGAVCSTVTNSVITPTSTASSQYSCYSCGTPLDGSFIDIEDQDEAVNLHFCDIKVTGTYKKKRDSSNAMKLTFVHVSYIPNTMNALPNEICFRYHTPPVNGFFESVFRKCDNVITGRYIINGADPGFPVKFQLSELVIYGQEVKHVDKYDNNIQRKVEFL
ncbi:DgyrCDS14583 [Dimorphilus gyrociliatus]|uniref:DgyrCDS14583 n=1 Tax=Dimorphilus gyrociliatus TaxID=2664684 RepID=A0A7I8WEH2_9ANNE|nr:DgyrCDS14583 [Dimorphilus gyrociliatus]